MAYTDDATAARQAHASGGGDRTPETDLVPATACHGVPPAASVAPTTSAASAASIVSASPTTQGAIAAVVREYVDQLVEQLRQSEGALQALADGQIDAVVDPATASPILLSHAQEALAASEARYRDLVMRAPLIVCELDPQGCVLFVNDAVDTLLGHDPQDVVHRDWVESVVAPDAADDARALMVRLASGDVTGAELPLRTITGGVRWIAWNSANRYSARGALQAVVLFGVDVTARREAEEAARRLAEAQVARAQAEAANQAKTNFLAVMSHELRTPLNAIGGYAQLLDMGLRGPVSEAQRDDLDKIRRSATHLLSLINDIMSFARLEAGEVPLTPAVVPVHEILDTIRTLTEPQIAAKGLTCVVRTCPREITVWADRDRVQQVLANLVANAVKFTSAGGQIMISCNAVVDRVTINVSDTGCGIPETKLEQIFEPFVQLDRELRRPQDGVGLGLAISRDLARRMGGDLTAASTLNVGSMFTLELPRASTE